jgi:hypothetical protein
VYGVAWGWPGSYEIIMLWVKRAVLAAALLNCAVPKALADQPLARNDTHWLADGKAQCAVFDANARAGDSVSWSGGCDDGLAAGPGTAAFSRDGTVFESFTGSFAKGVAQDGHVVAHWGDGWSYDGNNVHGQFNGAGVLINDSHDRFEGNWVDGKMNGPGVLVRASGERYEGAWKDDLPNGKGVLTLADGTRTEGDFVDGKFVGAAAKSDDPPAASEIKPITGDARPVAKPADKASPSNAFASLSGKTLVGIDGSSIALTLIDGGIERQIAEAGAAPKKTTFTFMTDRMGTVVEDGGTVANVTGFFRLTDNGVEVRYADGRSETLSANDDGVLMTTEAAGSSGCRSWYPEGHAFSEADKKAALAAYASKLGLQPAALHGGCPAAASVPPHEAAEPKSHPDRHAEAKAPGLAAHVAFTTSRDKLGDLQAVSVKNSVVHAIDGDMPVVAGPVITADAALPGSMTANSSQRDASHCLTVESDGHDWGFRNACDFAIQFAYCLAKGPEKLTACEADNGVNSVSGSVAANGFGALSADNSLSEKDADHDFRWVACGGGAGEVTAHLTKADPPGGRCDRAVTAAAH